MTGTKTADHPARHRIGAKEFTSTLVANLVIQGCTLAQGIILARLLGPEGRGQFAAAILWPSLFAGMGGLGVGVALARRAARSPELAPVIRVGIVLSLATGLLTIAVCAVSMLFLLPPGQDAAHRAAIAFLPFIVFNHLALAMVAIDQGAGRFQRMNWTRMIVNPLYLGLIILLWLAGTRDVLWFVVSLMAANGVVALVRLGLAARETALIGRFESVKVTMLDALPFGFAGLLNSLAQSADKAVLLYLLGTTELGLYTVALTAASVVNSLAGATATVSFGMSAQERHRGGFERVARMFRLTAWIWLVGGVAVAGVIPLILPVIYGKEFSPAILPAVLLIPAAALSGQVGILEQALRAQGRAFLGLEARLAGLVLMLMIGWFLTPLWGIMGVVVASVAAQGAALLVIILAASSHFHAPVVRLLRPSIDDLGELRKQLINKVRIA